MPDGVNPIANLQGKVNADNELVVALDGAGDITTTGTVDAAAYEVGGVAGVSGTFTSVTVVNGIVTAGT